MMTEELEKEIENKGVEYADKQERTISVHEDIRYSWGQVEEAYEKGALRSPFQSTIIREK